MGSILVELWAFMRERKKFWLLPILIMMVIFGGLIIFFLIVEPDGLARLWRNIRNYFRVWPFSY